MILQILTSTARNIAGITLILVGLVLWLTPIVPGGALMIPGIIMLNFPGKTRLFKRLEKTKWISSLLERHKTFKQIWLSLYTSPNSTSSKS